MNYSRFGAICELESVQAVAPQKPQCGTTVCIKRKSICVHFDVRKRALNVLLYMKELQISAYCSNVPKQCAELLYTYTGMSFCHGSVNCHLSDGRIDHFCESSKSVEFFTGV